MSVAAGHGAANRLLRATFVVLATGLGLYISNNVAIGGGQYEIEITIPQPQEWAPSLADFDASGALEARFDVEQLETDCARLFEHIKTREHRDEYRRELYNVMSLARCRFHGALIRYGDGEMALATGRPIGSGSQAKLVDKFSWERNQRSQLGEKIMKTIQEPRESVLYAISCTQCLWPINNEIEPLLKQRRGLWSYSVLFHNTNYQTSSYWLGQLSTANKKYLLHPDTKIVIVANEEIRDRGVPWADEVVYFPDDCVNAYETQGDGMMTPYVEAASRHTNALFLISGGPLAKWAVYLMHETNPSNFYVDVGSAADMIVKGRTTRPFHTDPNAFPHVCQIV